MLKASLWVQLLPAGWNNQTDTKTVVLFMKNTTTTVIEKY